MCIGQTQFLKFKKLNSLYFEILTNFWVTSCTARRRHRRLLHICSPLRASSKLTARSLSQRALKERGLLRRVSKSDGCGENFSSWILFLPQTGGQITKTRTETACQQVRTPSVGVLVWLRCGTRGYCEAPGSVWQSDERRWLGPQRCAAVLLLVSPLVRDLPAGLRRDGCGKGLSALQTQFYKKTYRCQAHPRACLSDGSTTNRPESAGRKNEKLVNGVFFFSSSSYQPSWKIDK